MNPALRLESLTKTFGTTVALQEVNIEMPTGMILAILGPSGCGKTTLLRCIAGFETPDKGTIEIAGRKVFGGKECLPPEQRLIGYVPQEGALFPHLNVGKNVAFGLPGKDRNKNKVAELLDLVDMRGYENRMPHELSGGQQQRVALARALAPSPALILLDEPFSSLDASLRTTLREDVRGLLKRAGATAIIVTHDQEEALSLADMVAVIREGRVVQVGSPAEIYLMPEDLTAASWVGDAVFVPVEIDGPMAQCVFGTLPIDEGCQPVSGSALGMIRPEQFELGSAHQGLPAQIERIIYYGHDSLVHLRLDPPFEDLAVCARILGQGGGVPGDRVGLEVTGTVMVYPNPEVPRA